MKITDCDDVQFIDTERMNLALSEESLSIPMGLSSEQKMNEIVKRATNINLEDCTLFDANMTREEVFQKFANLHLLHAKVKMYVVRRDCLNLTLYEWGKFDSFVEGDLYMGTIKHFQDFISHRPGQ